MKPSDCHERPTTLPRIGEAWSSALIPLGSRGLVYAPVPRFTILLCTAELVDRYTYGNSRSRCGSSMLSPDAASVISRSKPSEGRKATTVWLLLNMATIHVSFICVCSHSVYVPAAAMFHGQWP